MYKIIGADQKQYGPITGDQIRQWIVEGRVNGQTQVQAEGAGEWKPLSEFAEFADALGGGAGAPPAGLTPIQSAGGRDGALQAVKGPAIALKVTAIVGLVLVVIGFIFNVMTLAGYEFGMSQIGDPNVQKMMRSLGGGMGIFEDIIGAAVGVVVLMGASRMQSLKSYSFAFTASILAMLPCISPCCIFGLPFGIWALVVLNRPEVKSQFS